MAVDPALSAGRDRLDNDTGAGLTRAACVAQGFAPGRGYRKVRI